MYKTLYETICSLCKKKGVTIYQLCSDNEIPKTTIYSLKARPDCKVTLDIALRLANYFDVPVETFLLKKGDQDEVSKTDYASI